MNYKSCCFTGNRPQKLPWGSNENDPRCDLLKSRLRVEIELAIIQGFNNFFVGMAIGVDQICLQLLLDIKSEKHIDFKITAAIPCKNQFDKWSEIQIKTYKRLLLQCDEIVVISDYYTTTCMMERNIYMVDNSELIIGVLGESYGGTANTIKYAKSKNKNVIIINPIK